VIKLKKKVLVTGASGFIGSNLVERLKNDFDVYALVRYTTGRYVLGELSDVKVLFGDLSEGFRVREIVKYVQPDMVVHLGALSAQSYSYGHPIETLQTNFIGTVNLAEACYKLVDNFELFVFASTAETYGNQNSFPIKESQPLDAHSPYAVSKIASEYYLNYMKKGFNFPVTIMRAFNSYGRKRNRHFLVERVVVQMLDGGDVRLGDPDPVIDWVYVLNHVEGYKKVLDQPDKAVGETFNIATGVGTSIRDLALKISELTGWSGRIIWHTVPKRPVIVSKLVGDPSKIEKMLGWKAEVTLEDGLNRTINHWKTVV
jgi:nucleoside-diphosphate-sugar epimerase